MCSMIKDLMEPSALPDRTKNVVLVQTHISTVFVADEFVYKIKKPVNLGFLDFSTLEKRYHFCLQEVRLNKRLSEGIYLDVLPVFYDGHHYKIGEGRGEIVDYAVKMKRIPEERLMKSLFDRSELRIEHVTAVAEVLANFHRHALQNQDIDKFGDLERIRINTDENFDQTRKYIERTIGREDFDTLEQWTNDFYQENRDFFEERIEQGKIRDCHGDLHMEHICFTEPIVIVDCIEFNDRLRYTDTLADIGFLLMDLEYRDGRDFSEQLWHSYSELTGEIGVDSLLTFYKVYRAYVRGKVHSFQLDDPGIGRDEKKRAAQRAEKYFKLARSYIP